jgi:simple sugar transport system ATP-binding protein
MAKSQTQPLIETKDLVKKFGAFTALNGVSLQVYPGEVHALAWR